MNFPKHQLRLHQGQRFRQTAPVPGQLHQQIESYILDTLPQQRLDRVRL